MRSVEATINSLLDVKSAMLTGRFQRSPKRNVENIPDNFSEHSERMCFSKNLSYISL